MMVSKKDGQILRERIDKENDVLLSVEFNEETKAKDHLEIEFWLNPTSLEAYNFLSFFKSKLDHFEEFINFSPKYKFQNL